MSALDEGVRSLAIEAARAADAKGAEDIDVLDVSGVFVICDAFVLASGRTDRQVKAIADEVERSVREVTGRSPAAVEGRDTLRWVLVDYGDVVVHVFHAEDRGYYRLERLYGDVPRLVWAEAAGPSEQSVELIGIEPTTSSMPWMRSTN